jgi:hypothetical protein
MCSNEYIQALADWLLSPTVMYNVNVSVCQLVYSQGERMITDQVHNQFIPNFLSREEKERG